MDVPDSPDVQNFDAPRPYKLTRVGVRGVRKPVTIHRPGQTPHGVVADFDLFVDLPATQKGTHMSRNLEALADVLDEEIVDREARGLETLCDRLALRLLDKHDYAHDAHVRARGDFFLTRINPGGKPTLERYGLTAEARAVRDGGHRRRVGVEVIGMSACPCAMETARFKVAEMGTPANPDLPFITHNQRNVVTLCVDAPEGAEVEAADLVDLCEDALSAPTYELLKRGDEGDLVLRAHHAPKFVEDVVREALHLMVERYPDLPDDAEVCCTSEAEESIHKHNAFAERSVTMRDLRS